MSEVHLGSGAWVALLVWLAIAGAVAAFAFAAARRSRVAAILGCLLSAPTFFYLAATPRFAWTAPPAFVLLCVLAWRIDKSGPLLNGLLALPGAILVAWLAAAVLTQ